MEERIFNKVMEKVNIQIVNDASPAIDKLKKEIDKSLSNLWLFTEKTVKGGG